MPWWSWIIAGLVLVALEVMAPTGFFLCFMGLAAIIVGVLASLNFLLYDAYQWALFSVLSIALILFFRKKLLSRLPSKGKGADADSLVGKQVMTVESIAPGAIGKVDFRGTSWSARNIGTNRIESGAPAEIISVDSITLSVRSV